MKKNIIQEKKWSGKFGKNYISRNPSSHKEMDQLYLKNYGITRSKLNKEFLGKLNKNIKILEVGSNVGCQLMFLQEMGFNNLYGIEINKEAIKLSKLNTNDINIIYGSALDIPFKDNYFDLVFTSGVLIHISPKNIKNVMSEIHRCTNKYIWGFEYYSSQAKCSEIKYRGNKNLLWKANFSKIYLNYFKNLKLEKEKLIKYLNSENEDVMFILKKKK